MAPIKVFLLWPVVVVVVMLQMCEGNVLDPSFCLDEPYCNHNQSSLCGYPKESTIAGISCDNQLKHPEDSAVTCQFRNISSTAACEFGSPSGASSSDDLLFNLSLYYHKTWMTPQSVLNLTFPKPNWTEMKFRYENVYYGDNVLCRQFTLMSLSQPLVDTLFWDCPFFPFPLDGTEQFLKLTLRSDEGNGGSYIFTRPKAKNIDVVNTALKNWHTFFFIHVDHMDQSDSLPVTLQMAPDKFSPLSYIVSLVKCDDGNECQDRAVLHSELVTPSENDTQVTVFLPTWSNYACYAVTVQINSSLCMNGTINSCHLAVSPTFCVKPSILGIWMGIIIIGFVICFFTFTVVLRKRLKQTRSMLNELKEKPARVLMVYLPETQESLKLVNTLADFLSSFYIQPYLIDRLVGSQNPNQWTLDHLEAADRVLFLIPSQPGAESITHIRGQWDFVLPLLSGYICSRNNDVKPEKIAVITFPFSAEIPTEIISLQHFQLPKCIDPLLTWIHGQTWLDNIFLRCPLITSLVYWNKDQLKELRECVAKASEAAKKQQRQKNCKALAIIPDKKLLLEMDHEENSLNVEPVKNLCEDSLSMNSDDFDIEIPSVDTVLEDKVPHQTHQISDEATEEEGLDMSLLIV